MDRYSGGHLQPHQEPSRYERRRRDRSSSRGDRDRYRRDRHYGRRRSRSRNYERRDERDRRRSRERSRSRSRNNTDPEEELLLNRDISESHARSRAAERRRRKAQAECIRRAGGFQKLADQEGHQTVRLFWDGFQWVAKSAQTTILGGDPALMNSTRKLRRLYFGNLPIHMGLTETGFQNLVWNEMRNRNFCNDPNVSPVLYVWFAKDKGNYGFVEFATVEETERALTMDGMSCMGVQLRVSRPNDYSSTSMKSAMQQAVMPIPTMTTSSINDNFKGCYLHIVQIVLPESIEAEVEYLDVLDDVKEEFEKYGKIKSAAIVIPKHKESIASQFEVGDILVEFLNNESLVSCVQNMSNRKYENRPIQMQPLEQEVYDAVARPIIFDLEQMDRPE
ncbi:splicing factor subunit, putative [Theileria equi strain WA]|uniref:Splicing factor subunit, putative n=1 Tax=Theileria equi strain WA TaxID=1537102 RepID=L1L9Y6_THEEQ|nr:splicing factor subunit, putative [Theileria equi strain WA]EKX72059.1 splicing factor subunit, putative [Theileria equi strain WA]|eukprot:XP_004831511.1 splicing factor subunit, putative [Theileria equi strain WA]